MDQDMSIIPPEWWLPLIIVAWLTLFLMIMHDRRKNRMKMKSFQNGDWVELTASKHHPVSQFFDQDADNNTKEYN